MTNNCVCIPRVLFNTTENQIKNVFNRLNIGIIDRIDIIIKNSNSNPNTNTNPNTNSNTSNNNIKFKRVYIHFKKWTNTENARIVQERFQNNQDIKIIYEEPWFWKVSAYKKPTTNSQQYNNPTIQQSNK